jgi:N-sulfoglucosamine sulfohydrolase
MLNMRFPLCFALRLLAASLFGVMPLSAAEGTPQPPRRPNILFCIADDWSWPHAGAYGDHVVKTPNFDRVAREGALFTHAFCAAPSCSPSRAAILTGQAPHRLAEGGNLWGFLPKRFAVYPELLEAAGYVVGLQGKGWGPGNFKAGGRERNPAGPGFKSFEEFLKSVPAGKPFCFWFGSADPHRPYTRGAGARAGLKAADVRVSPWLPDTQEIRDDILDYYFEVERFDRDVGRLLKLLEDTGRLDSTLVVVSSDNGMPFPRAKTNLYDSGSRMPLAVRWPGRVNAGRTIEAFTGLADLAPTFLEAAGLSIPPDMTGKSLLGLLTGKDDGKDRTNAFIERERHANVRMGDLGYPARAVRTKDFLYVRNLRPERWPGGDPEMWKAVGPYGDCDASPSKEFLLGRRGEPQFAKFFELAFEKRPAEELYDLRNDPAQVNNVAGRPGYAVAQRELRAQLDAWMSQTQDPRASGGGEEFDKYPYFGDARRMPVSSGQ